MSKYKLLLFVFLFALLIKAITLSSQSLHTIRKIGIGRNRLELVEIPLTDNITIESAVGLGPSCDFGEDNILMSIMGLPILY